MTLLPTTAPEPFAGSAYNETDLRALHLYLRQLPPRPAGQR
ncbi:hypothetical protein [Pseudomonas sp. CGJS7]